MADTSGHIPVLLEQVMEMLHLQPGQTYVDATAGLGGHAAEAGRRVGASGLVVLNDVDPGNLAAASARVSQTGVKVVTVRGNFADLPRRLVEEGIRASAVLADLGFSSNQVDEAARGFSFRKQGPLDMRLDPSLPLSAKDWIAGVSEREMVQVLREYGEERQAARIARKVIEARARTPISSTMELARIVAQAVGPGDRSGIDPATRTFQAIRIAVNDELGCLDAFLESVGRGAKTAAGGASSGGWLAAGARVGVISFHSLEDRRTKRSFQDVEREGFGSVLTTKPIEADEGEASRNPRARSAKLRVIEVGGARSGSAGVSS